MLVGVKDETWIHIIVCFVSLLKFIYLGVTFHLANTALILAHFISVVLQLEIVNYSYNSLMRIIWPIWLLVIMVVWYEMNAALKENTGAESKLTADVV